MLIAAFRRRQEIEAAKVLTLVTAMANPKGVPEAYMKFLRLLMPEYDGIRQSMDQALMEGLRRDRGTVFRLSAEVDGWKASQEPQEK